MLLYIVIILLLYYLAPRLRSNPGKFIAVFVDKKEHLMFFLEEMIRVSLIITQYLFIYNI